MGVIFFGLRSYGRVDAHAGEYAQTQFFHVQFLPLIPRSSVWVTQDGDEPLGFAIKLHLKSVVAAYLRVWGALAAIAAFVSVPGVAGVLAGAALAGLSAWSWTWRSLRGNRARLRSDFRAVALGARCAPESLTDEHRDSLHRQLRARWGEHHAGRAPDEVARYGSQDVQEVVLAYGLLSLAAVERGREGAGERAAAQRLIDGAHDVRPTGAGPYRSGARAPIHPTAAAVSRLAAESAPRWAVVRRRRARRWFHRPGVQLAGLGLATLLGVGSVKLAWQSFGPPRTVTARQLGSARLIAEQRVAVAVDAIVDPGWALSGAEENQRVVLGRMGKHVLPIMIDIGDAMPGLRVVGRLRTPGGLRDDERWRYALEDDVQLNAAAFDYYLDLTSSRFTRQDGLIGVGLTAGVIALWVLWLRAWLARRRARAAA